MSLSCLSLIPFFFSGLVSPYRLSLLFFFDHKGESGVSSVNVFGKDAFKMAMSLANHFCHKIGLSNVASD